MPGRAVCWWKSWVPPRKFRDNVSIKPRPFPSKFCPVHQSKSELLTASWNKPPRSNYVKQQTDTLASLPDTPNIMAKDKERVVWISTRVCRSVGRSDRKAGRHAIYSISTNIKPFLRWCIGLTFRPPGGTNSRGSACTKQLVKSHRKAERSICSDSLHWIATVCEHSIPVQLRKIDSLANGMVFFKIRQLLISWRNSFKAAVFFWGGGGGGKP